MFSRFLLAPEVRLERTTLRLTAACSANWAIQEYDQILHNVFMHFAQFGNYSSTQSLGLHCWRLPCQLSYWGIWPNLHRVFMHFAQFGFCTLNSIFRVALLTLALPTELFRNMPLPDYSRNRASSGNYLLSRAVTHQVSSTWRSLTSVFGMGTGGPSLLSSPDFLKMLSHPQN